MLSVSVAQSWFKRIQSGNFDVKDTVRSGRSQTDKGDAVFEEALQDRDIGSNYIAKELRIDYKIVLSPLK